MIRGCAKYIWERDTEMLKLENVFAGYGEAIVLDDCSLTMSEGESIALLGRNGVGKSTLLLTVMGHTRVRSGSLRWCGEDLLKMPPYARARAGLGWVPQEREVFPSLTVEENLTVTALPGKWDLKAIYALFPRLQERRKYFGNQLSGGEQQMLAIGRALMLNPKVLFLDEPLEGLAPVIAEELCAAIDGMVRREGQALILVEQHVEQALRLTHRGVVLERGRVVHAAESADLLGNLGVLEQWVGVRIQQH
jgi:branched-chain amino acid transport system ATP-binding protein